MFPDSGFRLLWIRNSLDMNKDLVYPFSVSLKPDVGFGPSTELLRIQDFGDMVPDSGF